MRLQGRNDPVRIREPRPVAAGVAAIRIFSGRVH